MIVENGTKRYQVGVMVAETASYRTYLCEETTSDRMYLLQIAADSKFNGGLDRAAYVLSELQQTAAEFEVQYATQGTGKTLHYDRLFPTLVDSFASEDQGRRRVCILGFADVEVPTMMVPLSNLAAKDRLRVDLRTSAWIMGRLLKLLGFVHGEGIAVRMLGSNNILLDPQHHFAVVFDWSLSQTYQPDVPTSVRKDDIASAAKAVFGAIGGNPDTGTFATNDSDEQRYIKFLWNMASRREANAERAHEQFYTLTDEIFGRGFHEFKTLPL